MLSKSNEYQQLNDIEHIIKCPGLYFGEMNNKEKQSTYIYNIKTNDLETGPLAYNAALLKMYDELLMNAVDNIPRKSGITKIEIEISNEMFSIKNNGKSIPIEKQRDKESDKDIYIPELIFTKQRTSSNYKDTKRITAGMNGVGSKITVAMSSLFGIDIINKGKHYEQFFEDNIKNIESPKITNAKNKQDYTKVICYPNFNILNKYGVNEIDENNMNAMITRTFYLSYLPIDIFINGTKLDRLSFEDFSRKFTKVQLYFYETNNWNIALGVSKEKNKCISFVNCVCTYENGNHVKYIKHQVYDYILKRLKAKSNESEYKKKINSNLFMIIKCVLENPEFDSQQKDKLVLKPDYFKDLCELPDEFLSNFVDDSNILTLISSKKVKRNTKRITNVKKYSQANKAGTRESLSCTLFICEGLSAKAMVETGISVVGHDYYGCYALRGKVLNTMKASEAKYEKNTELNDIKKILNIVDGVEYDESNIHTLSYGKVVCVKDADSDGAAIMGLVINFFHTRFPSLLKIDGFFSEFITPMIKVYNSGELIKEFYNYPQYEEYMNEKQGSRFKVVFIKGLATNNKEDSIRYFKDYKHNRITVAFPDKYEELMKLMFDKGHENMRKKLIGTTDMNEYLPRISGEPINVTDFIKIDLAQFSKDACTRSIPSVIDGLKPTQRKILYTMMNKKKYEYAPKKDAVKVFQIGGDVASFANYHHGDQSMNGTIITMAQSFPGSNNIPLLYGVGQFGTRLENGNDAGAPRYIGCLLSPYIPYLFPAIDNKLLNYRVEDNEKVEPEYYIPIIPVVLLNGAKGIGTGWSTDIPMYNPIELTRHVIERVKGQSSIFTGKPFYRGFKGTIEKNLKRYKMSGILKKISNKIYVVTEIPITMSIMKFTELLNANVDKKIIESYNNYSKDVNEVDYEIKFMNDYDEAFVIKTLNLNSSISVDNLVAFDKDNIIKRYKDVNEIIDEWFNMRLKLYGTRIDYMVDECNNELTMIKNKTRFIKENIEEIINIRNKTLNEINTILNAREYDKIDNTYDYLLSMKIVKLSKEEYLKLCDKRNTLENELERLLDLKPKDVWLEDLQALLKFMEKEMNE